jgi:hypothetical protein
MAEETEAERRERVYRAAQEARAHKAYADDRRRHKKERQRANRARRGKK